MMTHREAARLWGVGRTTIQRAAASGKLSLRPDKTIDPAEMVRVFGEPVAGHLGPPMEAAAIPRDATPGPAYVVSGHPGPLKNGHGPVAHPLGPVAAIPADATLGWGGPLQKGPPIGPDTTAETARLAAEVAHLRAMLAEKDLRIDDLRSAMRMLTDQRAPPSPVRAGLWARILGR